MKTLRRGEFDFVVLLKKTDYFSARTERVRCTTAEYLELQGEIVAAMKAGALVDGEITPWETMPVRSPKTIRALMEG